MAMYAESIASRNTVATHLRALSQIGKPAIDIALNDDGQGAYNRSYSTSDKIEGEVSVTAPSDARFDDVLITFEGEHPPRIPVGPGFRLQLVRLRPSGCELCCARDAVRQCWTYER